MPIAAKTFFKCFVVQLVESVEAELSKENLKVHKTNCSQFSFYAKAAIWKAGVRGMDNSQLQVVEKQKSKQIQILECHYALWKTEIHI